MEQLRELVLKAKEGGFSNKEIYEQLMKKGYSKKEIDEAFGVGGEKEKAYGGVSLPEKIKLIITSPFGFFGKFRDKNIGQSLLLLLMAAGVYFVFYSIINFIFYGIILGSVGGARMFLGLFGIGSVFLIAFVWAGITHLIMKLFSGEGKFHDTFNVVVYSLLPFVALMWLPYIGTLIIVWSVVLMVFGLSEYHNVSKGKCVMASLAPLIVFFVLMLILFFIIIGINYRPAFV